MLKLGPTQDPQVLTWMIDAALEAEVDGFIVTNTLPFELRSLLANADGPDHHHDHHHDPRPDRGQANAPDPFVTSPASVWPRHDGRTVGGYSGPRLLDIAAWMVRRVRAAVGPEMPVFGVGGIQSGPDAVRLLREGATAIQLYTGLIYKGPRLVSEILEHATAVGHPQSPFRT
ncbi:MAG: hypothetical protein IPK13_25255 [Deltaproteobacteria bacterium]|nr:hypothetical protein [Deltaproteobacteria bacterium]